MQTDGERIMGHPWLTSGAELNVYHKALFKSQDNCHYYPAHYVNWAIFMQHCLVMKKYKCDKKCKVHYHYKPTFLIHNRACQPPWWPLFWLLSWHPIFKSSHCNSFEDWALAGGICRCPEILGKEFSSKFYWLMAEVFLVTLLSDECHWVSPVMSQHWCR